MSAVYYFVIAFCLFVIGWLGLCIAFLFLGGVTAFKNLDNETT